MWRTPQLLSSSFFPFNSIEFRGETRTEASPRYFLQSLLLEGVDVRNASSQNINVAHSLTPLGYFPRHATPSHKCWEDWRLLSTVANCLIDICGPFGAKIWTEMSRLQTLQCPERGGAWSDKTSARTDKTSAETIRVGADYWSRSPEDELRHLSRAAKLRYLSRLITYCKYRETHREEVRAKGRQRMAALRRNLAEDQRQRHRQAQARYRERARRAAAKKNTVAGKETKLRPKTRQYRVDEGIASASDGRGARKEGFHATTKSEMLSVATDGIEIAGDAVPGRPNSAKWTLERKDLHVSHAHTKLTPTNLHPDDVIMDTRGKKDPRYYCLPPIHRDPEKPKSGKKSGKERGFPLHLVAQGHEVGMFENCCVAYLGCGDRLRAKASLTGYPGASNVGCNTEEEAIAAWQALCPLGVHPHPVEPSDGGPPTPSASEARFVNTSPRKSTAKARSASPVKREEISSRGAEEKKQVLADLYVVAGAAIARALISPVRSPPPSRSKRGVAADERYVNFAIRGGGIVSSSPSRSEQRYLELQRSGQQPDMLVTRDLGQAAVFALAEDGEDGDDEALGAEITTMPRAGTADRRRRRLGLSPVKPGKLGWVHGTKLAFFSAHKKDYDAAAENKTTGPFYSHMAHLYLDKYGYNTPWDGDLEDDQDIADDVDPDEDVDKVPTDVAEERANYYHRLRNKIGVWYNGTYGGSVAKRTKKPVTFKKLFDQSALEPPAPVKPRTLHYYSRRFYHERVKARVTARWAAVSKLAKPPAMITVRNQCTKEAWNKETPQFQAEVIEAIKAEHKIAQEAYSTAVSGDVPTNAEGYNVIHAGMSNGLVPRIWSDFDRAGFDATQRSFVNFSHQCFTESECRERALNETAQPEGSVIPNATSTSDASQQPAPAGSPEAPDEQPWDDEDEQPRRARAPPDDEEEEPAPPPDDEEEEEEEPVPPPNVLQIGEHLQAEIDAMSSSARRACMRRLWGMSEYERERENNLARNRSLMAALDLASMSRDLLDEGGSTAAAVVQKAKEKRKKVPPQPEVLDVHAREGAWTSTRPRRRRIYQGPPAYKTTLAAPEFDRSAEGPLGNPGENIGLERPEFNRQAEGPLRPPVPETELSDTPPPPHQDPLVRRDADMPPPLPPPRQDADMLPPPPPPRQDADVPPPPLLTLEGLGAKDAGEEMWGVDVKEYDRWPAELRKACAAFARAKSWGGDDGETCVRGLIALERAWGFPEKGMLSAPGGGSSERPAAVPFFMKNARKWGSAVDIQGEIGPRGLKDSYADGWWIWWTRAQPAARVQDSGKLETPEVVETEEWADLAKTHGRNGLLLYLGGLLWWGEAATAAGDDAALLLADWRLAVRDVAKVLTAVLLGVAPWVKATKGKGKRLAAGPANAAAGKRKRPASGTDVDATEKENIAPLRKRTRLASALADSSHSSRRL
ncbi:hypothetical protein B0H11DRAFT_1930380 [Mycena galericulata]|nr:hypothetical protein B0H11DRAFT_1930380 [Mycena galericulata]